MFVSEAALRERVAELGAELTRDYAGREPLVVGALKACVPFICDLSRAFTGHHQLDFFELAAYGPGETGGHERIRLLKDLDTEIAGRDVLIVDEVIDTGLTLNYLVRTLQLRGPASLRALALFDRPYRRLVDDLPLDYVGWVVPDAFFVGYGFDVGERWRNLPAVHLHAGAEPA